MQNLNESREHRFPISRFTIKKRMVSPIVNEVTGHYRKMHRMVVRRMELEEKASNFAKQGVVFQRTPEDVYGGMPYVTTVDLAASPVTSYTPNHLQKLLRNGTIPGHPVGSAWIIDPAGVAAIRELEGKRFQAPHPGSNPGIRRPRRMAR